VAHCFVIPGGFELLDEVTGRHDLRTEPANEFERPGVYPGDVGVAAAGAVLHRHPLAALEQPVHAGFEFLPTEVDGLGPRQVIERRGFDAVDELLRLAVGGDEIEPAASAVLAGGPGDSGGKGVGAAEIVQKPAVEALFAEGGLHLGEVEHNGPPSRSQHARTALAAGAVMLFFRPNRVRAEVPGVNRAVPTQGEDRFPSGANSTPLRMPGSVVTTRDVPAATSHNTIRLTQWPRPLDVRPVRTCEPSRAKRTVWKLKL
jgi:hypothetical protein